MKQRKIIVTLIITFLVIIFAGNFNMSYADTGSLYLNIKNLRQSGYGYMALEKRIWKIYEANSNGTPTANPFARTIYCLRGGPGFGSSSNLGDGTPQVAHYQRKFDMKNPSAIDATYASALPATNSNTYKSLLWLLENIYIPPKSAAEKAETDKYRASLLQRAGINDPKITDEDIDAVQQLAVWHFTNVAPNDTAYRVETSSPDGTFQLWTNSVINDDRTEVYKALEDVDKVNGWYRSEDAVDLYKYLVDTATAAASTYQVKPSTPSYTLEKLSITQKTQGSNNIIGPFKINKVNSSGTISGVFKNGTSVIDNPTLQDASGNAITIQQAADKATEFYLVLPSSTKLDKITFEISGTYNETSLTYWSVLNAPSTDQPVVEVERISKPYNDTVSFTATPEFDLSLRKFITAIGDKELVDANGKYTREPKVDVTPLKAGKDTAIYEHPKAPVSVTVGNIVTYTIRVYNEGGIDGYVDKITDHLPEWLEFIINDATNAKYGWKVSSNGRTVTTDITSKTAENSSNRDMIYDGRTTEKDKTLLKAYDNTKSTLDYIDVKIRCKVKDTTITEKITNIAEITESSNNQNIPDRDNKKPVTLPTDRELPNYKDTEINRGDTYIPGQEDDDDFDKLIVQKFDLSLRKFITKVNSKNITNRAPIVTVNSQKDIKYEHPKTPVEVANGDIVTYTLRIYNEGSQDGYAQEIKDNLPEGLEYLPDNSTNKEYRWKMYTKDGVETTDVSKAQIIKTDYLSKEQETATGRKNLLKAFIYGQMTQPDYKDIKVAFKVKEPNTSNRILINTAEISEDADEDGNPVDDVDSTPNNNKTGEDDIDIEKVKVKYFDLALEKIITEYSIKKDGKTTSTKTKHQFGVQPEPLVKIELPSNSSIKTVEVKFKYQIKITNEGQIAGYATEIRDYIPSGLKFVKKDNPKWTLSDDGKTVTTDWLKDRLLQPGESAIIDITFQWINGEKNLGLKQNWAEISKDKNDSNSPDIDSTPDNFEKEEDDIDEATVILSVSTGTISGLSYISISGAALMILATGIILIKKFVI